MNTPQIEMLDAEMEHNTRMSVTPLLDAVTGFMQIAGQSTGKFDAQQAALYTGLQLEELSEKIEVLAAAAVEQHERDQLKSLATLLDLSAYSFKQGRFMGCFVRAEHDKLIDADFDAAWVSLGALLSVSPLAAEAVAHGTYTNLTKFPGGKCTRDANGKVVKPEGWQEPDFTPFVDQTYVNQP